MSTTEATLKPSAKGKLEAAHRARAGRSKSTRTFLIESPAALIELAIDLRLMTPDTATEIIGYYVGCLAPNETNDPVRDVAVRAAHFLMSWISIGIDIDAALDRLSDSPAWPRNHGITIKHLQGVPPDIREFQILEEGRE